MDSADSHWIPPPCIPCAPFTRINLMQGFWMTQTSASHISICQSGGTLWSQVKDWATSPFNVSMSKWKTHDTNLASVMSQGACSTCSATFIGNTPSGTTPQSSHNLMLKSGTSSAAAPSTYFDGWPHVCREGLNLQYASDNIDLLWLGSPGGPFRKACRGTLVWPVQPGQACP